MHFPSNNIQYMYNKPDALVCNVTCQLLLTIILHVHVYLSSLFLSSFLFLSSKRIKLHEKKESKNKKEEATPKGAVPAYLLDR